MNSAKVSSESTHLLAGLGALAAQFFTTTLFLLFVFENEVVARAFFSEQAWIAWLTRLGGSIQRTPEGILPVASLGGLGFISILMTLLINAASTFSNRPKSETPQGAKLKGKRASAVPEQTFRDRFLIECMRNAWWSIPLAIWTIFWIFMLFVPIPFLLKLLVQTVRMAAAGALAGWLWRMSCGFLPAKRLPAEESHSPSRFNIVLIAMLGYVLIYTAMNWGLWFNLQLPHGDSSMYEEHLWNVLHGKGFRSYLDQGLFLGEHIQVVHLLLLPLYLLWPSHLFMEMAQSIVLALGAIPVFTIARRHGKSELAATLLAIAYLFYFPMQSLDISIDLKTFRPTAFGITSLLFMIDAAERRRWGWLSFCVAISLSCQEDFGIAVGSYGVWMLAEAVWKWKGNRTDVDRQLLIAGVILTMLGPLYTVITVKYVIAWFRDGVEIHYASYFQAFGKTPVEIVLNILTNPVLLLRNLVTVASIVLFLDLLQPLGMPLRAWRQLLIGAPLFLLLCLNELMHDFPGPFHHFHAPLVPFLLWATCAGLLSPGTPREEQIRIADRRGLFVLCSSLAMGLFFSQSPFGLQFWDAGSPYFWQRLYVPSERAREFSKVLKAIPPTARVASTDFVHPRFTHYERSYDYSHYPRRVANYEDKVPDDTDYIVIDTGHRYSEIKRFEQMRESRNQRDQWEELPLDTKGYFIVLKRVKLDE